MPNTYSQSISTLILETIQNIENTRGNKNQIATCFKYFDQEYGGLSLGELVVIGGRPAMGKSMFAVNLISNMCEQHSILYFSFDLSPTTLTARLLSDRTGISVTKIIENQLIDADKKLLVATAKTIEKSKLFISDIGVGDINQTIQIIKQHVELQQTKIVVIDYLQLLGMGKYNLGREAEIGHICRLLKICAKELNICIVLLSQLSRAVEARCGSKKPVLSDLRDSGSIEQIADKVWLLYRPEYYMFEELDDEFCTPADCLLLLIIAKNKNGKIGSSYFTRDAAFTKFTSFNSYYENIEINAKRLSELKNSFDLPDLKINDDSAPF